MKKSRIQLNRRCAFNLTHSTPAVLNCYCSKGPAPYWSNPPFLIFDIPALWHPTVKNKNGGLDQYGKM